MRYLVVIILAFMLSLPAQASTRAGQPTDEVTIVRAVRTLRRGSGDALVTATRHQSFLAWRQGSTAIEQKLEDQAEFVWWWKENVTPQQSPERSGNKRRYTILG